MRVISFKTLKDFCQDHADARRPLELWRDRVEIADWKSHRDVLADYPKADFVGDYRYVFDIGGNKYRLVAMIFFKRHAVYVRFIGTHAAYDKINAAEI